MSSTTNLNAPSTSSLIPATGSVDLDSVIESYSGYLTKFQCDKAREYAEEMRSQVCAGVSGKHWACIMTALGQLASLEAQYFSFAFFSSKFSFRKDNHVREAYLQIKADLEKCFDDCSRIVDPLPTYVNLMFLLRQLICLAAIRTKLVEFYVFVAAENYKQVIEEAPQHLSMVHASLSKVLKEEVRLPQLQSVRTELGVLGACFAAQAELLRVPLLDSLLRLKALGKQLALWLAQVPFKSSQSKPHFFAFAFGRTPRHGQRLVLLAWLSAFYSTLLAKLALYAHDLCAAHMPPPELKTLAATQPSFLQPLHAFSRRASPQLLCLLMNRMESNELFYGLGYKNIITDFGEDNVKPIGGRHGMYPVLFYYPNERSTFEKYHPSIISLIQDNAESGGSMEKVRYLFDQRSTSTYFTARVEKSVHLTVLFNRKVSEKDQTVQNMFSEVMNGLRLIKLFHDLRQGHK